ncbi:hypothetical protein [Microcoleus sp. POL10_C6]|uniref:hypothetical protein n=1 Tax=unclassified Microcoleus TaxID=2642155 RepID=UPI002FD49616
MGHHTEEAIVDEAARIQKEVDKIFEAARSNNWTLEQFAVKVLAGTTDYDLGYFAIAAQLLQNVTNLDGKSSIEILKFLIFKVQQQDTLKIKQAQEMFFQGLVINKEQAEKKLAKDKQQQSSKSTSKKRRN